MTWTDDGGTIRWAAPAEGNEGTVGFDAGAHPITGPVLAAVQRTGETHATPPMELVVGGIGFGVMAALDPESVLAGTVGAAFLISPLLDRGILPAFKSSRYHLAVTAGETELYRVGDFGPGPLEGAVAPVRVADQTWSVTVRPARTPGPPPAVLVSFLVIAIILVAAIVWLFRSQTLKRQAVEDSEARYADLYENAPVAYCSIGYPDGTILKHNAAFRHLLGYDAADLATMKVLDFYADTPDGLPKAKEAFQVFGQGTETPTLELQMKHKDGSLRWIALDVRLVRNEQGEVVRSRGAVTDITARKEAEQGLVAAREDLEARVRQRTAELETANRELEAATDAAVYANRAKSEFLANTSHELRTPLNAILGFIQLMEAGVPAPLTEKQAEYASHIRESGEHLLGVINDILDLSKIGTGAVSMDEQDVALAGIVVAALRLTQERSTTAGLDVVSEVAESFPRLKADPRMLKQILINLVSNSIKFTPPGGRVCVSASTDLGGAICLQVADTGIGMTADEVGIALTKFGQVEGGLDRKREGTGLGLPLAKAQVELHGGDLSITSQPMGGTTVTIRFPPERTIGRALAGGTGSHVGISAA